MKWIVALLLCFSTAAFAGVEDDGEPVFLIAKPDMPDPNFARTVIVVGFPQDAGPMGVVLNRPSGLKIGELFADDRPEIADLADIVHLSGPVRPDGLLFVFYAPSHPVKALPIAENIYLSGDGRIFDRLASEPADPTARRFFAGHAGWAEGQLDAEIERGSWYVLPVDLDALLRWPVDTLWERLLVRASGVTARR